MGQRREKEDDESASTRAERRAQTVWNGGRNVRWNMGRRKEEKFSSPIHSCVTDSAGNRWAYSSAQSAAKASCRVFTRGHTHARFHPRDTTSSDEILEKKKKKKLIVQFKTTVKNLSNRLLITTCFDLVAALSHINEAVEIKMAIRTRQQMNRKHTQTIIKTKGLKRKKGES